MAVVIPGWVNHFRNVIKDRGFLASACEGNAPGTEVSGQRGRRVGEGKREVGLKVVCLLHKNRPSCKKVVSGQFRAKQTSQQASEAN